MDPILTTLGWFRRRRALGAALFTALLLLVAAERRLAEIHFNDRPWAAAIERADALDGDEIRIRLIVLNDDTPPSLADVGRVLVSAIAWAPTPQPRSLPLSRPASRGPPPLAASAG
jgi:hypothetical protein